MSFAMAKIRSALRRTVPDASKARVLHLARKEKLAGCDVA